MGKQNDEMNGSINMVKQSRFFKTKSTGTCMYKKNPARIRLMKMAA
jgi:hypothetical protein